jgi:hypothetical protein
MYSSKPPLGARKKKYANGCTLFKKNEKSATAASIAYVNHDTRLLRKKGLSILPLFPIRTYRLVRIVLGAFCEVLLEGMRKRMDTRNAS